MSGEEQSYDERMQALIDSGDVPDDVTAIAAALEGEEPTGDDAAAPEEGKPDEGQPDAAAQAGEASESDDTAAGKPDEGKAGDDKGSAEPAGGGEENGQNEPEKVVKTRDGKHEIPYSVLESERKQRRELERRNQELEAERKAEREQQQSLEARLKALESRTQATADEAGLTDQQATPGKDAAHPFEHLRGEYPDEFVDTMEAQHKTISALQSRLDDVTQQVQAQTVQLQEQKQADADAVRDEVQEAIDANDTLRTWAQEQDPRWDAAVAVDTRLRQDPEWAHSPIAERFDKVVEILTGKSQPSQQETPLPSKADTDKRVDEALANAANAGPRTHSDMPAGEAAAQSEQANAEQLSEYQLEQKLANMTPEQMDEYLARYG